MIEGENFESITDGPPEDSRIETNVDEQAPDVEEPSGKIDESLGTVSTSSQELLSLRDKLAETEQITSLSMNVACRLLGRIAGNRTMNPEDLREVRFSAWTGRPLPPELIKKAVELRGNTRAEMDQVESVLEEVLGVFAADKLVGVGQRMLERLYRRSLGIDDGEELNILEFKYSPVTGNPIPVVDYEHADKNEESGEPQFIEEAQSLTQFAVEELVASHTKAE